jgi:2-oxo-3-hexenedioate decarboxylase
MTALSLSSSEIVELAERVDRAHTSSRSIPKLTDDLPSMTLADGYAVQLDLRRRRLARGERSVGWKASVTSRAKMVQVGVHVPTVDFLTNLKARPESSAIRTDELVHPRVECEVAFVMGAAMSGAHCTREQVLAATDFVVPALEVIDSRYAQFRFDLPSVVADNCSAARYVTGERPRAPRDIDLRTLGVLFE